MVTDEQYRKLLLSMSLWLRLKVIVYSHFNVDKAIELIKQHIKDKGKDTGWELINKEI